MIAIISTNDSMYPICVLSLSKKSTRGDVSGRRVPTTARKSQLYVFHSYRPLNGCHALLAGSERDGRDYGKGRWDIYTSMRQGRQKGNGGEKLQVSQGVVTRHAKEKQARISFQRIPTGRRHNNSRMQWNTK